MYVPVGMAGRLNPSANEGLSVQSTRPALLSTLLKDGSILDAAGRLSFCAPEGRAALRRVFMGDSNVLLWEDQRSGQTFALAPDERLFAEPPPASSAVVWGLGSIDLDDVLRGVDEPTTEEAKHGR